MAVKTKDVIVNIDEFVTGVEAKKFDAKGKNSIRIDGVSVENAKKLDFRVTGDFLVISDEYSKIIIKNYKSIKYLKTEYEKIGKKETFDLYDLISNNVIDNDVNITQYNVKKLTATGTNYNDVIDLRTSGYVPVGTKNIKANKGLSVDGGNGNDFIAGTDYNDVIKGGSGDDTITGGKGNDTITGGSGSNKIIYSKGDGNDVINLTKGENFTLELTGISDIGELNFTFVNNNSNGNSQINSLLDLLHYLQNSSSKGDLRIYTQNNEYITIKNFVNKDVTNNSTKKTEDTSSVELKIGDNTYDLREYLYKIDVFKNYTGSWLNEEINASCYTAYDKKGNEIFTNKKGLSINSKAGDDVITGSKYNDTIKGENGDDTITGGKGNDTITGGSGSNKIIYSKGDGNDVINLTKGENFTLKLNDINNIDDLNFEFSKKDLRIYTQNNEYITIKNFVNKDVTNNLTKKTEDTSSVELKIGDNTYDLREYLYKIDVFKNYTGSWLNEEINASCYTAYDKKGNEIFTNKKGLSINSKAGDDVITGSKYNDTLKGGNGDDTITGGKGNDKLYGEAGSNTFIFNEGDGQDTIYSGKGEDTLAFNVNFSDIKFEQVKNSKNIGTKDLIITYGENDTVTIKDYFVIDKKGNITGTKSSVKNISTVEGTFDIEEARNGIVIPTKILTDRITVNAGNGDDEISVFSDNNKIYGGAGNDEIYCSGDNNTIVGGTGNDSIDILNSNSNTVVFNNGDGNDTIGGDESDIILKFNDSVTSDFKLEKFGNDLIIKYNSDKDSVTISNYIYTDEETGTKSEYAPNYTIEDKNGNKTTLDDFIKDYTAIPNSTITEIVGTDTDDYINIDKDNLTVNAGNGDDEISVFSDNNKIYGGAGNDVIYCSGDNNTIVGGTGNDSIDILNSNSNTVVFNNGDGNDTIGGDESDIILKFNDSVTSDFKLEKFGNDLIIKYNSDKDSVTISDYIYTDEETGIKSEYAPNYTIEDKNGNKTTLDDFIKDYTAIPNSTITEIVGTDTDDYINIDKDNLTVNAGKGDDEIYLTGNNNKIYGGAGNDEIYCSGDNNTIVGGTGNDSIDILYFNSNTVVFNNGDGNDTIGGYESDIILKFNDSVTSDFKLEKFGNDLIIKYNSDKDSVTISNYIYTDEETGTKSEYAPNYTIEDKNGNKTTLDDFIKDYTAIPNSTITEIVGTDTDDYIYISNISKDTIYNAQINKSYIIDDVEGEDVLFVENTSKDNSVNIVFDVANNYTTEDGIEFGDVLLLDNDNFEKWKENKAFNGITIKNNAVETINYSENTITSAEIAQLAQSVASWLATNNFTDVNTAMITGTKDQVAELTAYFTQENNFLQV